WLFAILFAGVLAGTLGARDMWPPHGPRRILPAKRARQAGASAIIALMGLASSAVRAAEPIRPAPTPQFHAGWDGSGRAQLPPYSRSATAARYRWIAVK